MIKCLFGKSLKQLFIISLISCFILLGSSSVNAAGYFGTSSSDLTVSNYNSSYDLTVSDHGNFFSSYLGGTKMLFMPGKGNFIYWSDSGVPYIYHSSYINNYDGGYTYSAQGLSTKYFVCSSLSGFSSLRDLDCDYYNIVGDSVNTFSNYLSSYYLGDYYFYYWGYPYVNSQNYLEFLFCFTKSLNGNNSLCFGNSFDPDSVFYHGITLTGGLFDSDRNNVSFDSISSSLLKFSPYKSSGNLGTSIVSYTGSRLSGRLAVESGFNNKQMIEGYECVGLQPSLCYGGFPINDIFQPSEQFEDFTGYRAGQGATMFEIYSLYSGNFPTLNGFLDTVLTRYRNGQINSFKTEPKALLMLGAQMNTAGIKTSYIADYCDLLLNKNNTNQYQSSVNSINDLRVKACLRSQSNNLRTSSGDYVSFQTSHVGIFGTGENISFEPDVFFSNLMDKFSTALENIPINGTLVGIIPGYIIVFLLAFIFIRMISH